MPVVYLSLLVILQDLVCIVDIMELDNCISIVWILVRMVFDGKFSVSFLNFTSGCCFTDTEDFVEISSGVGRESVGREEERERGWGRGKGREGGREEEGER